MNLQLTGSVVGAIVVLFPLANSDDQQENLLSSVENLFSAEVKLDLKFFLKNSRHILTLFMAT